MEAKEMEYMAEAARQLSPYRPEAGERLLALSAEAFKEAAAMRQPITAEALLADGWVERWKWFLLDGRFRMCWSDDDNRWEFEVGRVSDSGTFMHGVIIASPSTMHDLRELSRMLRRGAK